MNEITLIYGNLLEILQVGKDNAENVVHLSDTQSPYTHHLKKSSAHLIPSMEEKITKAIVVLESEKDIGNVNSILEKTQKDKAGIVFILPTSKKKLISKIPQVYLTPQGNSLIVIGEIIGEVSESNLSKIFQKAIGTRTFEIEFGTQQHIAVISEKDAQDELRKQLTSPTEKISLLFYEKPQTLDTAVVEMTKVFPEIEIKYDKNPKIQETNHKQLIKDLTVHFGKKPIYATTKVGFAKSVKSIKAHQQPVSKKTKKGRKKLAPVIRPFKFTLLSIVIFVMASTLITIAGVLKLKSAQAAFQNSDIRKGQQALESAQGLFSLTYPTTTFLTTFLPLDNAIKEMIISGDNSLTLVLKTITEIENALRYQSLHNSQHAISQLTYAYFKFSQFPSLTGSSILGENTSKIASVLQGYSDIPGIKGEGNYLLLFQNNAELRPTGGFIGSVGELRVKQGKIADFTIRDVYQLDGQLKVHFEPHFIVRRHLQPHLYLRDSNFDIEFDMAAKKAAQIYQSETSKSVDGVIAIDFEVVRALLKHTGKIEMPEHDLTLTEDKARELIHSSIHENVFPGSSKKKDILQSLMTKLILKLENDPSLASSFAQELPSLLEQKHILFSFQDENVQKLFSANDYTGSINDHRKKSSSIFNDIFGWNEANIGVNKANEHIQRRVEYEAYMGEKSVVSKATLHIFNTGKGAQDYTAYMRLIAPIGSTLESLTINGVEQKIVPAITDPQVFEASGFTQSSELEVDENEEDQYKTFGFITKARKGTSQKIVAIYTSGEENITGPGKYSLMYIKQPGTTEYPIKAVVVYDNKYTAKSEKFNIQGGTAEYASVIRTDQLLELGLSK